MKEDKDLSADELEDLAEEGTVIEKDNGKNVEPEDVSILD